MKHYNWVDLKDVPKKNNRYDWDNANNIVVPFSYNGIMDICIVKGKCKDDVLKLVIEYNNTEYVINRDSFRKACLGQFFGYAVSGNYAYTENQIIESEKGRIRVDQRIRLSRANGSSVKGYNLTCLVCGYSFNNSEGNLVRGDMCPVCSNHKVKRGVNDLWTTFPEIAKYLTNEEDGYKYSKYSNKKVDLTCPICMCHIGKKQISVMSASGISCPSCGDNISYPNKFMYNLLNELNIDFETEQGYKWCVFPDYNNSKLSCHGRYDFIIPKKKVIIEMDSSLGHGKQLYTNSNKTLEETLYKDRMKDLIAESKGYKVIRIDCSYTNMLERFPNCVKGIMNSVLSEMFDLSIIDWNKINLKCMESFVVRAAELYKEGISSSEIAKMLNKDQSTIIDYLHQANGAGLCTFIPDKKNKRRIAS